MFSTYGQTGSRLQIRMVGADTGIEVLKQLEYAARRRVVSAGVRACKYRDCQGRSVHGTGADWRLAAVHFRFSQDDRSHR